MIIGITIGLISQNYPIRLPVILEMKVTCPISLISCRLPLSGPFINNGM